MQNDELDEIKSCMTRFEKLCGAIGQAGIDPFTNKDIEREPLLARIDSQKKFDSLKKCIATLEQLCGVLEDAGVDTSNNEFIDDESFLVYFETNIDDMPCYASLTLPADLEASVYLGISDDVTETSIHLNYDEDVWTLHAHQKQAVDELLSALLTELKLGHGIERIIQEGNIAGIVRTFGRYIHELQKTPTDRRG